MSRKQQQVCSTPGCSRPAEFKVTWPRFYGGGKSTDDLLVEDARCESCSQRLVVSDNPPLRLNALAGRAARAREEARERRERESGRDLQRNRKFGAA